MLCCMLFYVIYMQHSEGAVIYFIVKETIHEEVASVPQLSRDRPEQTHFTIGSIYLEAFPPTHTDLALRVHI